MQLLFVKRSCERLHSKNSSQVDKKTTLQMLGLKNSILKTSMLLQSQPF